MDYRQRGEYLYGYETTHSLLEASELAAPPYTDLEAGDGWRFVSASFHKSRAGARYHVKLRFARAGKQGEDS